MTIESSIQRELARCLRSMGQFMDTGKTLVETLELGIAEAKLPRLKETFQAMLDHWRQDYNIMPPVEKAVDVFPRSVYWMTQAGFFASILDREWMASADLLEFQLSHTDGQARFCMTLGVLLKMGVAIGTAFDVVADEVAVPGMGAVIADMKAKVWEGQAFSGTVAAHPELFSKDLASAIERAEQDGSLLNTRIKQGND